ncbi:dihydrofolate synthase/folylpolyglutamate synthase [Rhodothalassium salexigens DSM 2132]|uniref:tetrahydrofolate synthase n=1 Tax=Rhodothalassium salexigens DSM 2132 TaxID=1188247 RepID=A0A4R2PGI0_RHOSA|nr:folylpolyglutamate synthase/dihydrofolate synthase family protein [Rhodothalassium salexigens]MBB4211595.1 dihydrofolate synthase/folylpolyglutamate synthase [Rhodothalassium salexigens DSM 2132]TCP34473.1 dihydrofolate synthase/folylpolyglutamate synthase [Rhodothalassium salexigens DSM 2132]
MSTVSEPDGVEAALARLKDLHPKVIDLSLGRIRTLLDKLGNPERRLPPVLHVAGTNGKGSVVATTRAIAEAAGLRVHVYTSPHLVRFNERIRLAGSLIADAHLVALIDEVVAVNGDDPITFFEVTTAAAFKAFADVPADLAIVEVGLGGRFDATNVIPKPAACAITPVSLDHKEYLGEDVAGIAAEKAGILKREVPAVIGPQLDCSAAAIRRIAREARAPLHMIDQDWTICRQTDDRGADYLVYRDTLERFDLPMPGLPGAHQIQNAGVAVALLRHQDEVVVPAAAYRAGLEWVRWPARLQRLTQGSLREVLPEAATLWLDGGHNEAAGQVLRRHFSSLDPDRDAFFLVVGMMKGKEHADFLGAFSGLAEQCLTVPIPGQENTMRAGELAGIASAAGYPAQPAASVRSALKRLGDACPPGKRPVVLITGSLYLAGEVLRENGTPPV